MNCYLYCRKSTEDKTRQIQSINDQKKIMTEIAKSRGLKIREIFTFPALSKASLSLDFFSFLTIVDILCKTISFGLNCDKLNFGSVSWIFKRWLIIVFDFNLRISAISSGCSCQNTWTTKHYLSALWVRSPSTSARPSKRFCPKTGSHPARSSKSQWKGWWSIIWGDKVLIGLQVIY